MKVHKREDKDKRLRRLSKGSPIEIIETLLNSIDNFFNNQIDLAAENDLWHLVILGDHAVALILSEGLFGEAGINGFKTFLEKFVDNTKPGFDFSAIASDIHNWRNVIAHQWLSSSGYDFGLDFEMEMGWEKRDEITYFNPSLYHQSFSSAFSGGGRIWQYQKILTEEQMQEAKDRLLKKYISR